jgi:alanine dehydrogenase
MGPTIGLPRMHKEPGERRDFLPELVACLDHLGAREIVLEETYGSGIGIAIDDYVGASCRARVASHEECLEQDVVLVLRCPEHDELRRLRPGAVLVSMLHYATRPERTAFLADLAIRAVSLDAITDGSGRRLVENLEAVAWNGVRAAFREIRRRHPNFDHPSRRPLHVTCLGAGGVGGWAVLAATRYGDPQLREALVASNVPGVEVTVVDFDLTLHEDYMLERLEWTDLLVDATRRTDPSRPVVPNVWLSALPADGVLLDLACDPYDLAATPPVVKGIEGVPHGSLDRYVFPADDDAWDRIDPRIDTRNRRVALSCYSWPGLEPIESMRTYGEQLEPILAIVLAKPTEEWGAEGASQFEHALARAEVSTWIRTRAA